MSDPIIIGLDSCHVGQHGETCWFAVFTIEDLARLPQEIFEDLRLLNRDGTATRSAFFVEIKGGIVLYVDEAEGEDFITCVMDHAEDAGFGSLRPIELVRAGIDANGTLTACPRPAFHVAGARHVPVRQALKSLESLRSHQKGARNADSLRAA